MGYETAVGFVRRWLRMFFRRIEVDGVEHVPETGGGVLVAWHPNGVVDPALILASFPRRVVFGARHGLFRWPLLGALMRALGTVPIYRAQDAAAAPSTDDTRRARNQQSLDALAREVANGSFSALFPEGQSHDAPHPVELKTGAARLYYRACELREPNAPMPVLIPVGLHYDHKSVFRSEALVAFHPPIELMGPLAPPGDPRLLTQRIEAVLHDVVHATESWDLSRVMHRTRKLVRAERAHREGIKRDRADITERTLGYARVWAGYRERKRTHPAETQALLHRVTEYDADLRTLGISDHDLDDAPPLASVMLPAILLLQGLLVYLLLPPLLLIGYAVNGPTYLLVRALSKLGAKARKDEASIKLLAGLLLFPLTWLGAGMLVATGVVEYQHAFRGMPQAPLAAGAATAVFGVVGGAVVVRYLELARQTWRSLRVRLTRHRQRITIAHLREERAALCDAITRMAEGLDLPSKLSPDRRTERHTS